MPRLRLRGLALGYGMLALFSAIAACLWHGWLPPATPAGFPMAFYRNVLGTLDGRACPSYPVCSRYASQAIERHGLLLGSWLALDRLIHESDDLSRGPWIRDREARRLYDPLSRNDFWLTGD